MTVMGVPHSHLPRWMRSNGVKLFATLAAIGFSLSSCLGSCGPQPPPLTITQPCHTVGTHDRLIIFLHGVNQDASKMGVSQNPASNDNFVPLINSLGCIYKPADISIFQYLDDQSIQTQSGTCPASLYPPCASQSSVTDNAMKLAQMISNLYSNGHHKVTLIAYSMGGAITRSALAGCPAAGTGTPLCNVAPLVSDVVFMNSVQQGSWLLALKQGLDTSNNDLLLALGWGAFAAIKATMGLGADYPAEMDMTPVSNNIQQHNLNVPPNNIHYFNFFGDIQIRPISNLLGFLIPAASGATLYAGDLVLLPGLDNPQKLPTMGGSRFCMGCESQDNNTYASNGMYSQWAMTDKFDWDYSTLVNFIQSLGDGLPSDKGLLLLGNIINAPEAHLNIASDTSMNGANLQVEDRTGKTTTTSLTNEILWELEKEDGIPS